MALSPYKRLEYAESMGDLVSPEVVALLVHTYLNKVMARTRQAYIHQLPELMGKVDGVALFVLAYRYVNVPSVPSRLLRFHEEMAPMLLGLIHHLKLDRIRQKIERSEPKYFCGVLQHRIIPRNLAALLSEGLKEGDMVLYEERAIKWNKVHPRGSVNMIRVPMGTALPATLL